MPRVRGRGRGGRARGRGATGAFDLAALPPELLAQVTAAMQATQQNQAPLPSPVAATASDNGEARGPPQLSEPSRHLAAKEEHEEHNIERQRPDLRSDSSRAEARPPSEASETSTAFSFAQEVQRQQANLSSGAPSTPTSAASSTHLREVYQLDLTEFTDSTDVDPTMCPICLVVPKQSEKKRYCITHQRCFECIERAARR